MVAVYGGFLRASYVDRTSTSGEAYGLVNGESLTRLPLRGLALLGILSDKDAWDFYLAGNYHNAVRLKFCDGKLCRINRHGKYFEIP